MNSNYRKSSKPTFDFDLGLSPTRSQPQKHNPTTSNTSYSSSSSYSYSKPNSTSSSSQPSKPSWTHQPSPAPTPPGSMVGDIFGKSWGSSTTPSNNNNTNSNIGVVNKSPHLFGDLVSSALGQNKGNNSAPLKNSSNKNTFSMGVMADSLPKSGNSSKSSTNWGNFESFGSYASGYNSNNNNNVNVSGGSSNNKSSNLVGTSMKSVGGNGGGMGGNKDPFGNLVDFGLKSSGNVNLRSKGNNNNNNNKSNFVDGLFGDFQNLGSKGENKGNLGDDSFGVFQNASKSTGTSFTSNAFPTNNSNKKSMGASMGSYTKVDDFGGFASQNPPPPVQSSGLDALDLLFSSSSVSSGVGAKGSEGVGNEQFSGGDDWGFESEFGGGNDGVGTTELEGLPPPPAGISSSAAKNKGMDNYKQGQYADAIKWLSWAIVLLEKAGDDAGTMEVLSCRASCYKEVGEYKKAVADCTKILEQDSTSVAVLVQRALLYESMEKYKLGAEDLRTVMKLDPCNRVARSTIHRMTKMAE